MKNTTCTLIIVLIVLGAINLAIQPVLAVDAGNEFDTNVIYVIRSNQESAVRMLDETKLDEDPPVHIPPLPTDPVYNMDLGHFGSTLWNTYPITVFSARGQDMSSAGKSICFTSSPTPSNSKVPGAPVSYTTAGARFFGVYEVSDLGEGTGEITYSRTSFQIVELNAEGRKIRVMQVGLAANIYCDNEDELHRNENRDSLVAPHWGDEKFPVNPADPQPWVWTRNNLDGCEPGTIRYNPAKNTIAVAAVVGAFGKSEHTLGSVYFHEAHLAPPRDQGEYLMGRDPDTPAYPRFRVYEFELPDWPEDYYEAGDTWEQSPGNFVAIPSSWIGEPVPVYDPALVRLVQIYELPGNIQASNGRNRNPYLRPSIDFDNDGNMYCTGLWYSAKHPPCWTGGDWRGECVDDYRGDVVRFNTLGHRAGRNIYHVPVEDEPNTPENESLNLIVERVAEEALGHVHYWAPTGMAVRKDRNELLVVCKNQCDCVFAHIFDLNNRIGSGPYPNELVLKEVLKGNVARADETCIDCDESNPPVDPECPYTFIFETPKQPYYAQNDDVSGRTFMANFFGDCGGVQNFMVLQNDPAYTVIGDVGYKIYVTDPNGQPPNPDTMNNNWDACSPALASDKTGACCDPSDGTCQNNVTQTSCYDSGGIWLGKGTVCGQSPCPGQGACCTPCEATCTLEYEDDCQSPKVWQGIGIVCAGGICEICSPDQTMDADCDGDIDQDDFAVFQQCYTGAGNSYPSTPFQCKCFDYGEDNPGDGDIDSFDYDAFQSCATGPNVPAGGPCP